MYSVTVFYDRKISFFEIISHKFFEFKKKFRDDIRITNIYTFTNMLLLFYIKILKSRINSDNLRNFILFFYICKLLLHFNLFIY